MCIFIFQSAVCTACLLGRLPPHMAGTPLPQLQLPLSDSPKADGGLQGKLQSELPSHSQCLPYKWSPGAPVLRSSAERTHLIHWRAGEGCAGPAQPHAPGAGPVALRPALPTRPPSQLSLLFFVTPGTLGHHKAEADSSRNCPGQAYLGPRTGEGSDTWAAPVSAF